MKNKNIHILPTDKPSRLRYNLSNKLVFTKEYYNDYGKIDNQHIYITSDEEIKEGDWFIRDNSIHKCFRVHKTDIEFLTPIDSVYCGSNTFWNKEFCKKIILTTDQDLIKDGVQAIDDDFLEWFVKNPSCEEVEVIPLRKSSGYYDEKEVWHWDFLSYKIIIPKEELNYNMKQEILAEMERLEEEPKHILYTGKVWEPPK